MHELACKLRNFFPKGSQRYRLYDGALLLAGIALLWYVTTTPSEASQGAIGETVLSGGSVRFWGIGMLTTACMALICIYLSGRRSKESNTWLDIGYGLVLIPTGLWAITLFIGGLASLFLETQPWDEVGKTLGSALWFAFACSNTLAALMRERKNPVCVCCQGKLE